MRKNKIKKRHPSLFSTLFHKPLLFLFLLFFLPFLLWGVKQTQQVTSFGKNIFIQGNSYGSIDPIQGYPAGDPPPEQNPDLNPLVMRGYIPAGGERYPIDLSSGEIGFKTPQIGRITDGVPIITSNYRVNSWVGDFRSGRPGVPMPVANDPAASVKQIQMIGIRTSPGQAIKVPPVSGNPISPEYNAMVLFANDSFITLKYTREDNIGINNGYAIQIDGISVSPNLLNLYNDLNASGRGNLPAVSNGQEIGTAIGNEIRVLIRDTGDFLDPRSKLDWWQGIDYPEVPTDIISPTSFVRPTNVPVVFPTTAPTVINQPISNQPTIISPHPTTFLPTATNIILNPTNYQPPVIIPSNTPVPTPTPKPAIFSKIKSNIGDFLTTLWGYTKYILP